MVIDIEVTNIDCKILNTLTIDQLALIQSECMFEVENSKYCSMYFKKRTRGAFQWDGKRKLFNIQTRRFPVGLLYRVTKLLRTNGFDINTINKRKVIDNTIDINVDVNAFQIRQYQEEVLRASLFNGNGICKVATGGGKTVIAGLTIANLRKRTIFIVHTRDLLYQTKEVFEKMFNCNIGQIGDGIIEYEDITVATMQTLAILGRLKDNEKKDKFDEDYNSNEVMLTEQQVKEAKFHEYTNTVQCIMMDEVQIVSSQTAYGVRFLFEYANYAFGYSASPWRDDGSDLMIEAAFGTRIVDISASKLIRLGYLVKPTIIINSTTYDTSGQPSKYVDIYKKYIVENKDRNIQVCNDAIRQWIMGKNTLILVTQIKHGQAIEELLKEYIEFNVEVTFISGKSGMKKRKKAIQDMRDGKISLMIATTIADVGLDIPRLDCIVEAGAGKSSVTALQRLGRIMRPFNNKESCTFITYRDNVRYLRDHIERKKLIWQVEEEFEIIDLHSK